MIEIKDQDLYENGLLIGKSKSLWNPKMRKYLSGIRMAYWRKSHIFNPSITKKALEELELIIRKTLQEEGTFLFVGTKPVVSKLLKNFCEKYMDREKYSEVALKFNYVVHRWIGGTITNFRNISSQVKKYKQLVQMINSKEIESKPIKEQTRIFKIITKKQKIYQGLVNLRRLPNIVFVIDCEYEKTAIKEANQKGIFVISTTNSHADPTKVSFALPMNDDWKKPISYLLSYLDKIIEDEVIAIRAQNENLTKEEYLERQKMMDESERKLREGIQKINENEGIPLESTTENIVNKLTEEE